MQSDELDELVRPFGWGARSDLNYSGPGNRYIYDYKFFYPPEGPGRKFVGVSWRQAAMYCNWLHNGKTSDPASLMNGAYDTSTFTQNPDGTFNDQSTRSPGAAYWIPSLDEYLKAAFYDPNRYGEGEEGWWESANSRDRLPIGGVPGVGETNAGFTHEDFLKYGFTAGTMPVGSYPDHQSPWGLLDISGSAPEWTEEWDFDILGRQLRRQYKPSQAGGVIDEIYESNWFFGGARPWQGSGFRIASMVPGPSTVMAITPFAIVAFKRRRRSAEGLL